MKSNEKHKKNTGTRDTVNQRKRKRETLQKNTDKNLIESKELFRLLCEVAEEGIAIHDNGVIVEANRALARMYGYELPEMIGMYGERIFTHDSWKVILKHIDAGYDKQYEVVGVRKDGSTFECFVVGKLYKYKDRTIRIAIFRDVTERRRTERILRRNKERLRGITQNLPGIIFQFYAKDSGEYGLNYLSEPRAEFLKIVTNMDTVNMDTLLPLFFSRIHEEDKERFRTSIKIAVKTGTSWNFESRVVTQFGEILWLQGLATPTRQADQLVFDGILLNITERKLAEEKSRFSEEKFFNIFMTTPDCIGITRLKDGLMIDVNKAYEDMVGWKREEVIGTKSTGQRQNFWVDPSARKRMVKDLQAGRDVLNREFEFRRSDGSIRNGVYSARSINIDGEECLIFILQDVTERKLAEEKFHKIFMTSPYLVGITRLKDGILMDLNKAGEDILGWKRESIIGKKSTEPPFNFWVDPAAREFMAAELEAGRDVLHREVEFRRGDGSLRNGVYSARSINIDGKECLIFILQDITERKQAKEQIRKSEGIFRVLFNQSVHFLGLLNTDGTLLQINTTAKISIGIREEDVLGKPFWLAPWWSHSPDEQERLKKAIKRAANGEFIRCEITYFDSAGVMRYVDLSISPVKDDNGVVILLIPDGSDITERKQAENDLMNSHRRLDEIIDFLPDATFVIDCEGKVITWNRSMEQMSGIPKRNMIGKGNYEYSIPFYGERRPLLIDLALLPEDVFKENHYGNVYREGETLYVEYYVPGIYGGKGAFMWGKASKLRDASGNIIGAIESIRDITGRKKAEDELKLFAENLEDANIALRVLMNSRDKDQKEFEEKLQVNINELVIPYLKKLSKGNLDDRNKNYVAVLEKNLSDVLSPFMRDIRSSHNNLTPQEIQIVDLIRQGKNTKEIANMLNASVNTIATHRNNLRKKLNLRNSKINLRSHILSYE